MYSRYVYIVNSLNMFYKSYTYTNIILVILINLGISVYASKIGDIQKHHNFKLLPKDCGKVYPGDRIVGGKEAQLGQFPWLARLGYVIPGCVKKTLYRCGGALINDRYVITAGHCVIDLPITKCPSNDKTVTFFLSDIVLGEHNSATNPDCIEGVCAENIQTFLPEKVIVHPSYNKPLYSNDLCLMRLNRRAKIHDWVSPICLPRGKQLNTFYTGVRAEVAGWGTTDLDVMGGSNVPMVVKLPILDVNKCAHSFTKPLNLSRDIQMCAGGEENRDSCDGDSGTPLMYPETHDGQPRYFVLGLVSFGVKKCGKRNKPAIYTRLAGHMKWILDNMKP